MGLDPRSSTTGTFAGGTAIAASTVAVGTATAEHTEAAGRTGATGRTGAAGRTIAAAGSCFSWRCSSGPPFLTLTFRIIIKIQAKQTLIGLEMA